MEREARAYTKRKAELGATAGEERAGASEPEAEPLDGDDTASAG